MVLDYIILTLTALFLLGINDLINFGKKEKKLGSYKSFFCKHTNR